MQLSELSSAALRRAATIRDRIDSLENELITILERGGIHGRSPGLKLIGRVERKRRNLSLAARKRIGDAARDRWAKVRGREKKQ